MDGLMDGRVDRWMVGYSVVSAVQLGSPGIIS